MVRLDSGDVPLNVAMSCESEMWTMVLLNVEVVHTPQYGSARKSRYSLVTDEDSLGVSL